MASCDHAPESARHDKLCMRHWLALQMSELTKCKHLVEIAILATQLTSIDCDKLGDIPVGLIECQGIRR